MGLNSSQLLGGQSNAATSNMSKLNSGNPTLSPGITPIPLGGFNMNPPQNSWNGTNFIQPDLSGLSPLIKKNLPGSGTPGPEKKQGFQGLFDLLSGGDISSGGGGLLALLQQLFSKGKSGEGLSGLGGTMGGNLPFGSGGNNPNALLDAINRLKGGGLG